MNVTELLPLLRCPETRQPLTVARAADLARVNQLIASGVQTRGGKKPAAPIDAGLIRDDRKFLYPIRNEIPIMLIEEAIPF